MRTNLVENTKAIVSSKGQVVIPRELRAALGIHAGTELRFERTPRGTLEVSVVGRSLTSFFGRCKRDGGASMSVREMDEIIIRAVIEDDERTRGGGK